MHNHFSYFCVQFFIRMNRPENNYPNILNAMRPILVVMLLCFGFIFPSPAQNQNGKIQTQSFAKPLGNKATVSLLTVSPGEETYAQYGHTALRVNDPENGFDLVFNYGLFDFNSPNFTWRFVRGKTDYMVGAYSYQDFLIEYQISNRAVYEQIINLNPDEREAVWQALAKNIQPENRIYRYNFFFNNCSTKPRDILVDHIKGKVDYKWNGKFKNLRDEIHFSTNKYPWTTFGIDLVIGAKADDSASLKSQQFAPELLMESFDKAIILRDSAKSVPLVLKTLTPVAIDESLIEKPTWTPGPKLVLWIVFILVAGLSLMEFRKGKNYQALNAVLYTVTGLVGTIIAFMVLFSEHPTTDVNYLLLWLHPLNLIYAVCLLIPAFRKNLADIYLSINLPFQLFALAGTLFLPQYFHPALYPILLCLIMRSGLALVSLQKKRKHA